MKKWLAALLVLACLTAVLPALAQEPVTLSTDVDTLIVIAGKKAALKLEATPAAAHKAGLTYRSSDESIATVDARGNVRGVAQGECQIVAASKLDPSVTLAVPVQVVTPVKKITASIAEKNIRVGQSTAITIACEPENATLKQAVYASSKESVATVSEDGIVTGVSRGEATITVRSVDGAAKTTVRVKVEQQPTGITLSPDTLVLATGKKGVLKATVLPKNANNKKVVWSSSDESIATVDQKGRVTSIAPGEVTITAACEEDPTVSASVTVRDVRLAKSVVFDKSSYDVILGQTIRLQPTVLPEDTTDKAVTYKVKNSHIASVDENGVVTGLKGGKTTVTVTSADGSRRRSTVHIRVVVPVTGVSYRHSGMRVGAGSHATLTVNMQPADATNKNMTWVSSDESIATVKGTTNRVRVQGRRWGRCQITGTTEEGGYSITLDVNVGSLRRAVKVQSIEIKDGRPYIVLKNHSDMEIDSVSYAITGTDAQNRPIRMSTKDNTMYGTYDLPLVPGARTHHGRFTFFHQANYTGLEKVSIAITGWTCADGYYNNDGGLEYTYVIPSDKQDWVTWESDVYRQTPNAN